MIGLQLTTTCTVLYKRNSTIPYANAMQVL